MALGAGRLDLGDLDLLGADGGYGSYSFATQGDDVDFGEPQPIDITLSTLMADGAPAETTRYENRDVSFRVEIVSPDSGGLAEGEAALLAEIGKRTTLTWTPPDSYGPPTVFRVETSRAKFLFNDLDEIRSKKKRVFQLTLTCLPFARSSSATTIGAEFVADTVAIADDCESATGWSATDSRPANNPVAVSVDSSVFATGTGALKFTPAGVVSPAYGESFDVISVTRSGLSIDASAGGYFVMRVRPEWSFSTDPAVKKVFDVYLTTSGGGREAVTPVIGEMDANGFLRLSFSVPNASTITKLEFKANQVATTNSVLPAPSFWVDSLGLAASSSTSQNVMTFYVGGSMRCEASFQVSALVGLGDVLLYTVPDFGDGFRPDLRRGQLTGANVSDAAAINGTRVALSAGPTFSRAASMYRAGSYAILGRVKRSAPGNVSIVVNAQTKLNGVAIGSAETLTSPAFDNGDANYHVVRLGVMDLPPLLTDPASNAEVVFTVNKTGTPDVYLDEMLLFPLEDHALTWVQCGSGSPSSTVASRLWIDEPTPANGGRPVRIVGNDEGRLDGRYAVPLSAGRHVLKPGPNLAYLLTDAVGGADLLVTFTKAWHSNAGE